MSTQPVYKSAAGEQAIMDFYESVLERWPVPCETRSVPTRYGDTFVVSSGDPSALPMVMLHGSGTNSAMWGGDVAHYAKDHRTHAIDIPGEPGKSATNRFPWDVLSPTEWLEDVFDGLGIEQMVLIGCSLGGWLVTRFAVDHPERVKKLILLCPAGVVRIRTGSLLRIMGLSLFGQWGAESIRELVFEGVSLPKEVETFNNLVMQHTNPRTSPLPLFSDTELQRLTMPTLLVAGAKDYFYASDKTADRLQHHLPDFAATILPDAGHVLLDTTSIILPFLRSS